MSDTTPTPDAPAARGGKVTMIGLALLAIGGLLTAVAYGQDAERAGFGSIIGFGFAWCIVLGSLFFVALQFVSSSVDYWFNSSIEDSLQESLGLAQTVIQDFEDQARLTGDSVATQAVEHAIEKITRDDVAAFLHAGSRSFIVGLA